MKLAGEGTPVREFEVNCVVKPNPSSPNEDITHIGHSNHGWRLSIQAAIRRIEAMDVAFYMFDLANGQRAYLGVVREPGKPPYLRTHSRGRWNDNLLALENCAAECELVE